MRKLFLAFLLIFLPLSPSYSHNSLVSASPSSGSVLVDFPMEIVLDFNEELLVIGQDDPNSIEVFDAAGELVSGDSKVSGARISAGLSINGNGSYSVKYRVVSKDGHVVEGDYQFNVESPIAIASPMPISAPVEPAEDGSNLLIRIVVLAALGFGIFISFRKANS